MKSLHQIVLDEYFEPTIGKAIRVTLAFILPLLWGFTYGAMEPAVWIAITAQVLSNVNIQGSYPVKLLVLSGAVLACAVCASIGTWIGGYWVSAAGVMLLLAFLAGFVRQSGMHGPGIAIGVLLMYLLSLDSPGTLVDVGEMFIWVLMGGILALIFTLIAWAFVPFNPFRRSISLTWKALSDWLQEFSQQLDHLGEENPVNEIDEKELALREELNKSMEMLSRKQAIAHARQNRFSYQLVELRRIASFSGNAVSSLRTIAESAGLHSEFPGELFHYVLLNLSLASHRIALSIITHRPEEVYSTRLSIERVKQSVSLFLEKLSIATDKEQFSQALHDLIAYQEEAEAILLKSFGKRGRTLFFIRNFLTGMTIPQKIPKVRFEFNARSFTFRFSLRLALVMTIGIGIYKYFHIPHGYWIAMTTMIVLQPEFGATFKKAFDRLKGTILGAVIGSLLFLLPLPFAVTLGIVALCSFLMTYYLMRNYAVAAFFITVMVIALFHLLEPVTWQLGGIRILNTLAGAGLALIGGYAFWPLWERYRFPDLISQAIAANCTYMNTLLLHLNAGEKMKTADFVKLRREAEMTNSNAFHSLRRMEDEPGQQKDHIQLLFIITGNNIRITRLLNTLNQQISVGPSLANDRTEEAYRNIMVGALSRIMQAFQDIALASAPTVDEMVKEVKINLSAMKDPLIHELSEKLAKEIIGMYYSTQQLMEHHTELIK